MSRWLLGRLAQTVAGIWLLASAVFLLSHLGPGAEQLALPDTADPATASPGLRPAARQQARYAYRQRLGLDLPLFYVSRPALPRAAPARWQWHGTHNQYHRWAGEVLRGRLGYSIRTGQPVSERIGQALAHTLPLTGAAIVLTTLGALLLARWLAAGRPAYSRVIQLLLTALQAPPLFVVAMALLLLFANPAWLDWFPVYESPVAGGTNPGLTGSGLARAVLPVASLVLTALPALTLQLEQAISQELRLPYVLTARAKGLSTALVVNRHALRNALLPLLTQFTGLLPALFAGAVVVEVIFAIPGMGRLLVTAATTRDYPVLVGALAITGASRLLALLLADVLYAQTDPRIRWQR
ncbi:ABC transporter permease [Hymenobacter saemangeumensis]|uniref:ABC transporter permease n=1 Tax=Hymenobacter saemangeumensis TaxID=1084522 RepID=A0ABP8IS97_9BACT